MRIRIQGEYKAVFTDSFKTLRLTNEVPATPELEDVAINSKCYANCGYCYVSATKNGINFPNIVEKAHDVYGSLLLNDRPFQIAIGGEGEPTLHPQFIPFIKTIREFGIIPNYTTNGMHFTQEILNATEQYCGGVALSWHPHIPTIFYEAANKLSKIRTKFNIHIIVGDEESFSHLMSLYTLYNDVVDYFVLLPYQVRGRAKELLNVEKVWKKIFSFVKRTKSEKFAFGALFYSFLKSYNTGIDISIYDPDVYSGYRILNENYTTLYKSSYEQIEK